MEVKTCRNLEEIRTQIDTLDASIVELIAARSAYIRQAAGFKTSIEEVKDPKRVEAVIERVRERAMELGMQPTIVENLYRTMIDDMVGFELEEFTNRSAL